MSSTIEIRPLDRDQYEQWYPLWQGYLTFYKSQLPDDVTQETWKRFHNPDEDVYALGAHMDQKLVGIAHYILHRSTWSIHQYCYLNDLFTLPEIRGHGIATALIAELEKQAKSMGAERLYWTTQEDNATARKLYDKVSKYSGFVQYRTPL